MPEAEPTVTLTSAEWRQLQATLEHLRDHERLHAALLARWAVFAAESDCACKLADVHRELDRARADIAAMLESAPAVPTVLARAPVVGADACS